MITLHSIAVIKLHELPLWIRAWSSLCWNILNLWNPSRNLVFHSLDPLTGPWAPKLFYLCHCAEMQKKSCRHNVFRDAVVGFNNLKCVYLINFTSVIIMQLTKKNSLKNSLSLFLITKKSVFRGLEGSKFTVVNMLHWANSFIQ